MKLTRILLSICCAAAVLTACSKADNKAKVAKTHPVTITVDLDNALTKTTLSYDSENHKWIQNWKDGDAISVIYADGSNNTVNEKFVLVSGAGTKTGVFHCDASSIPTSGTTYVLGIYPYSNLTHFSWIKFDYQNQGDGSKDNLGKYIIMYSQMKFIDGNFDSFRYSPEYVSFILKLTVILLSSFSTPAEVLLLPERVRFSRHYRQKLYCQCEDTRQTGVLCTGHLRCEWYIRLHYEYL